MNISNIELNKKFTVTFKGFKAIVNYRIDEDWFSVYYYRGDEFLKKDVRKTISEQHIINVIRYAINKFEFIDIDNS